MNVILSNLLALAGEGAFGTKATVEPMSGFKWLTLYDIAVRQDIAPYVSAAIEAHVDDVRCNIPDETRNIFQQAAFTNVDELMERFGLADIEEAHLAYPLKRYVLKDIVESERHSIDTSRISLDMLSLILQNTNLILRYGIRLRAIISLGLFLRKKGQRVDFVRIESWLSKMKLSRMARLQASVLTSVFGFEKDEFPYISKLEKRAEKLTLHCLERDFAAKKYNRSYGKYTLHNCIKFYRYTHSESLFKMTSNVMRSLSEIEE